MIGTHKPGRRHIQILSERVGWGPPKYMKVYISRWTQLFNKTHVDRNPPYHGETSLWYALKHGGVPVGRIEDEKLVHREVAHDSLKCELQAAVDMDVTIS